MVTITAKSTELCVSLVGGVSNFGKAGTPVEDSQYYRAYCYICGEPIRVSRRMLSFPNACSMCQPDYRGRPGVNEAERNFWFEQYYADMAEVLNSGEES